MVVDVATLEFKLLRQSDGVDVDLSVLQGTWTVEQYLKLTDATTKPIEFSDGTIEVLPMPTDRHQVMLALLYELLAAFVRPAGGIALFSALRLQVAPSRFREPDILVLVDKRDPRRQNAYWLGADLVVEIVSPDAPERDTVQKVLDYAAARIPEYWIVNPLDETITVLTFVDDAYRTRGVFGRGERVESLLLAGFSVSTDEIFDAE